jgi:hypothetical protein
MRKLPVGQAIKITCLTLVLASYIGNKQKENVFIISIIHVIYEEWSLLFEIRMSYYLSW